MKIDSSIQLDYEESFITRVYQNGERLDNICITPRLYEAFIASNLFQDRRVSLEISKSARKKLDQNEIEKLESIVLEHNNGLKPT